MEQRTYWKLGDDAVVKLDQKGGYGRDIFVFQELKTALAKGPESGTIETPILNCQVLEPGSHWKRGKFRLVLEFIPEEESQT